MLFAVAPVLGPDGRPLHPAVPGRRSLSGQASVATYLACLAFAATRTFQLEWQCPQPSMSKKFDPAPSADAPRAVSGGGLSDIQVGGAAGPGDPLPSRPFSFGSLGRFQSADGSQSSQEAYFMTLVAE